MYKRGNEAGTEVAFAALRTDVLYCTLKANITRSNDLKRSTTLVTSCNLQDYLN